ncbi:MucB/RseB C-terminal domain-containing protein [Pseudomonas sp. Marseille-QA0892]
MRRFTIPLLLLGIATSPVHASDAEDWLGRIAKAEQHSFQGVFIYEKSGSFSSHQLWHLARNGQASEKLLQLDGPPIETIRVDGQPQCVSAGFSAPLAATALVGNGFDVERLKRSYHMKVLGESRVAGRPAQVVGLLPKDQHRYGLEVHIDTELGLPLKMLLVSDGGQLLERFQFTQLSSEAPLASSLEPEGECIAGARKASAAQVETSWRPDWVPAGFEPRVASQTGGNGAVVLNYGDGLANFSIFVEPVSDPAAGDARSQVGPTSVVSKRLNTGETDYMVTVVGEIPLGTAERIALSTTSEPPKG